jgi:hypothetical protein
MKVYGIYEGCIYEGGGCDSNVYIDINEAIAECKKRVKLNKKQEYEWFKSEPNPNELDISHYKQRAWRRLTKVAPNYWSNGMDCVCIQEFNIVDFNLIKKP